MTCSVKVKFMTCMLSDRSKL